MPDIEAIRTAAEELKALSEKATALPWVDVSREGFGIRSIGENGEGFIQVCDEPPSDDRPEDMAYIVAACNLAPALLALTDSLTAERDELRLRVKELESALADSREWCIDRLWAAKALEDAIETHRVQQTRLGVENENDKALWQSAQERREGE